MDNFYFFKGKLFSLFKCFLTTFLLLQSGCDLFEYSPNDVALDGSEKSLTARNLQRVQSTPVGDTLHFIVITDTQRFYDETADFVKAANKLDNITFVALAGDITDFGLVKEFKLIHKILSGLKMPYLTVIGNHDMISNGEKIYREMYGDLDYSFIHGRNKFIFLNSNSREYNFNGKIPNLNWLQEELKDNNEFDNAVVISHVPSYDPDFDSSKTEGYTSILRSNQKLKLSISGHQLDHRIAEHFNDGVTYITPGGVEKRSFMIFSLWKGGWKGERIFY